MKELFQLIKSMDLPDFRKTHDTLHNLLWLKKNLGKFNSSHPDFNKAMALIKGLTE